jgi:FlaA1/EpsC-like NDP-sugar epimerase
MCAWQALRGTTVLVTGAGGNLGKNIVDRVCGELQAALLLNAMYH